MEVILGLLLPTHEVPQGCILLQIEANVYLILNHVTLMSLETTMVTSAESQSLAYGSDSSFIYFSGRDHFQQL